MFQSAQPANVDTPADAPITSDVQPVRIPRPRLKSARQWWRDIIEIVLIVVTIYTFVNLMTARAIIEGVSMQPNFATNQLVIVNRFSYYFKAPSRGDAVVISNPTAACKDVIKTNNTIDLPFVGNRPTDDPCADYIKRIIGLPGEVVSLKKGRVYINGTKLDEPYISPANICDGCQDQSWQVGPDEYFVLGDNRNSSYDSHYFGPIKRTLVIGEAWIRYWPLQDAGLIPHPIYGPIPATYTGPTLTPTPEGTPAPKP